MSGRRGSGSSRRRRSCLRGRREGRTGGSEGEGGRRLSQREGRQSESVPGPPFHLEIGGRTAENGLPSKRSPSQALKKCHGLRKIKYIGDTNASRSSPAEKVRK